MDLERVTTSRQGRRTSMQNLSDSIGTLNREILQGVQTLRSQLTYDVYAHNQKLSSLAQELNRLQHARSQQIVTRNEVQERLQKFLHTHKQNIMQQTAVYRNNAHQKSEKLREDNGKIQKGYNNRASNLKTLLNDTAEINRYLESQESVLQDTLNSHETSTPFVNFINVWKKKKDDIAKVIKDKNDFLNEMDSKLDQDSAKLIADLTILSNNLDRSLSLLEKKCEF
ncbi:unnamed protein product [Blepharisma stoltei]|uniref:SF-assemblin n=1 Tax=Blepharisma stoltei TaxID=1481888 RepID=A0AAU9K4X8_9CILI|nr:unnamed protein product [Blepharisma stoltei]